MAKRSLKARGRIDCIAYGEETRVGMLVEDSGMSIAVEELPKIWELLYFIVASIAARPAALAWG
jgi:hypothetical protein